MSAGGAAAAAAASTGSPSTITPFRALCFDGSVSKSHTDPSQVSTHHVESRIARENLDGAKKWVLRWADKRERRRRGYFACTCAYFDAEDHT